MFEGIVSGFLSFFKSMVSVYVSENVNVELYVLRIFQRYIILFCISKIRRFLDLHIPWENEKNLRLSGF